MRSNKEGKQCRTVKAAEGSELGCILGDSANRLPNEPACVVPNREVSFGDSNRQQYLTLPRLLPYRSLRHKLRGQSSPEEHYRLFERIPKVGTVPDGSKGPRQTGFRE